MHRIVLPKRTFSVRYDALNVCQQVPGSNQHDMYVLAPQRQEVFKAAVASGRPTCVCSACGHTAGFFIITNISKLKHACCLTVWNMRPMFFICVLTPWEDNCFNTMLYLDTKTAHKAVLRLFVYK